MNITSRLVLVAVTLFSVVSSRVEVTVHVVPHSHVDPMWKFTPEEYMLRTDAILDTSIVSLLLDAKRTFVWESLYFLDLFLKTHGKKSVCGEKKHASVHFLREKYNCFTFREAILELLNNGQLELVGGGWTAHDEALTDFYAALDNLAVGRRWVAEELGHRYNSGVAWFLDSFGHSSGTSSTLAGMGYESQVLNRVPFRIKRLVNSRGPSFFVYNSERRTESFKFVRFSSTHSNLLSTILPRHYSSPPVLGSLLEHKEVKQRDIERAARELRGIIMNDATTCPGIARITGECPILLLVGDDFSFRRAERSFTALEYVLQATQTLLNSERGDYRFAVQLSTPSRYFSAVKKCAAGNSDVDIFLRGQSSAAVPTAQGHLLPYSDHEVNDWTGYYGSRPVLKHQIRDTEDLLRGVETVITGLLTDSRIRDAVMPSTIESAVSAVQGAHRVLSLGSHHDTITGTSRRYVVESFMGQLEETRKLLQGALSSMLAPLAPFTIEVGVGSDFNEPPIVLSSNLEAQLIDLSLFCGGSERVYNIRTIPPAGNKELCLSPEVTDQKGGHVSVQELDSFEFSDENGCESTASCDHSNPHIRKLTSPARTAVSVKHKSDGVLGHHYRSYMGTLVAASCGQVNHTAMGSAMRSRRLEEKDNGIEVLRELARYMSIRVIESGKGWHSSGAYLLRTPFNALLSALAAYATGAGCAVLIVTALLLNESGAQALYRRSLQAILSLRCSKRLSRTAVCTSPSKSSTADRKSSPVSTIISWVWTLAPVIVVGICVRAVVAVVFLSWYYTQHISLWVEPVLPFESVFTFLLGIVGTAPFNVGLLLYLWVPWVATMALGYNKMAVTRRPAGMNIRLRHLFRLLVIMGAVFSITVVCALALFLWYPEGQSTPLTCGVHTHSDHDSGDVEKYSGSIASSILHEESGSIVSELTSAPCPGIIVSLRLLKDTISLSERSIGNIEVDVRTRLPLQQSMDVFFRIDLDYWKSQLPYDLEYSAHISDGHWEMKKTYDWFVPLSANLRPVSHSLHVTGVDNDGGQPLSLSIFPSHPIGAVVYKHFCELSLHRSHLTDDEKGLLEPLVDDTRSFTSFKILSRSLPRIGIQKHERSGGRIPNYDRRQLVVSYASPDIASRVKIRDRLHASLIGVSLLRKEVEMRVAAALGDHEKVSSFAFESFDVKLVNADQACVIASVSLSLNGGAINVTDDHNLCTLDCLVCPWNRAASYLSEFGLLALKVDIGRYGSA